MSVSSKLVELNLVPSFVISTDPAITMTNSLSSKKTVSKNSINIPKCNPNVVVFDRSFSLKHMLESQEAKQIQLPNNEKDGSELSPLDPKIFTSPRPLSELQAAAVTVQKVYKSYRTRRNLADCAILVEEMWWKAIDFATLSYDSVSFYKGEDKPEKVVSRWTRARKRVSKFAKGLSKDEKAQKLAMQHWLEAIDPRHRYGHNLHLYYEKWFESESTQPFFYWLDVGHGKDVVHEKCPRSTLHKQCIRYLGPIEREVYEVIVENGRLVYKLKGEAVETDEGSKWIFVLSTSRCLYVGQKKKGVFQHSSFLAGAATTAAGRLVAHNGKLEAIWPYSGHYHPTEENFREFISFLEEHNVDLSDVKRYAVDDDTPSYVKPSMDSEYETAVAPTEPTGGDAAELQTGPTAAAADEDKPVFEFVSCKWSTGAGPRIGIVRDYPTELQCRALEQVNLSPRVGPGPAAFYGPIPSPRPSPKVRISPRLTYLGIPSPRTPISECFELSWR